MTDQTEPRPLPSAATSSPVAFRRVRKAYEQVADQLRELIITGELVPSQRLPNEAALANQFGVSRATVREALRVLSTQSLIRTTKGATGGSFVTLPSIDHISQFMHANIALLSQTEDIELDEFLEARELLEVPAARLAARRHSEEHLQGLRESVPDLPLGMGTEEQFVHNRDFHSSLVVASGNALLTIAAQPIFSVLQTNLQRSTLGDSFHARINADHKAILAAVEQGDENAAGEQMHAHLQYLRPMYEKAWLQIKREKR